MFDLLNESLINPVERKELVSLSSGVFPGNQIVADLDQAYEKGKKSMENFINDRLISLEKSIYTPIKKLRLGTFSKIKKQVTVKIKGKNVQFNYQSDLFGKIVLILQKRSIDLEEVFMYPLGPIPYALADDLGVMVKTRKRLEKDIIYVDKIPRYSCNVINGMALVRKIKGTGLTFNQLTNDLLSTVLSTGIESTGIDVVFDVYKDYSIKNAERKRRCEDSLHFKKIIGSQTIRQWNTFLGNNTNKTELVKFLVSEWRKKRIEKRSLRNL